MKEVDRLLVEVMEVAGHGWLLVLAFQKPIQARGEPLVRSCNLAGFHQRQPACWRKSEGMTEVACHVTLIEKARREGRVGKA
ncbi:hypothetical protein D3C76_1680640 [compost metagenome]